MNSSILNSLEMKPAPLFQEIQALLARFVLDWAEAPVAPVPPPCAMALSPLPWGSPFIIGEGSNGTAHYWRDAFERSSRHGQVSLQSAQARNCEACIVSEGSSLAPASRAPQGALGLSGLSRSELAGSSIHRPILDQAIQDAQEASLLTLRALGSDVDSNGSSEMLDERPRARQTRTRKRHYQPYTSPSSSSSSGSSRLHLVDSPSSSSGSSTLSPSRAARSRNNQVELSTDEIDAMLREGIVKCPLCDDYVQHKRRMPDMRRHLLSHAKDKAMMWTCYGVPLEDALQKGWEVMGINEVNGRLFTRGCRKTFSRRDACKRHIDNPNNPCLGEIDQLRDICRQIARG